MVKGLTVLWLDTGYEHVFTKERCHVDLRHRHCMFSGIVQFDSAECRAAAIYGDFSSYQSKSLRDFINESNQGKDVFFPTREEAIKQLIEVK